MRVCEGEIGRHVGKKKRTTRIASLNFNLKLEVCEMFGILSSFQVFRFLVALSGLLEVTGSRLSMYHYSVEVNRGTKL